MKTLKKRTISAFFWDVGGKVFTQMVGLAISIILTRILAPDDFGLMAMVLVVFSLTSIFITSGLDLALIQRKELRDEHFGAVFYFNLLLGIVLTLISFFTAGILSEFYGRAEIKPLMRVASFSFLIYSFGRVKTAWLSKNLKLNVINKANIFSNIIGGVTAIILAYSGYGVWSLVIQSLLIGLFYNVFIFFTEPWTVNLKFSYKALKELWGFGFKMFLSSGLNTISANIDNMIIGRLFKAELLGYYFRAKSLNLYFTSIASSSIGAVIFPALSSINNDIERLKHIFLNVFHITNYITFLSVGLLFISADEIIIILFTEKWIQSAEYFKILLVGVFAYPVSTVLLSVISSMGNSSAYLKLELIKQLMVICCLIFGFLIGLKFYLYLFVAALYVSVYFNVSFTCAQLSIKKWQILKPVIQYYMLGAFTTLTVLAIKQFVYSEFTYVNSLIISTMIFLIVYSAFSYLFKPKGYKLLLQEADNLINYIKNHIK